MRRSNAALTEVGVLTDETANVLIEANRSQAKHVRINKGTSHLKELREAPANNDLAVGLQRQGVHFVVGPRAAYEIGMRSLSSLEGSAGCDQPHSRSRIQEHADRVVPGVTISGSKPVLISSTGSGS
jgi:hypothetical protein